MKYSQGLVNTITLDSKKIDVSSAYFCIKAGLVHQTAAGFYCFTNIGQRVLSKIEAITRKHMDLAGALEVSLPTVQPAELWKESGRWEVYGEEMFKFKNREGKEFCLGPTHEEVICDYVRAVLKSYKQLPFNLYQINRKFRDELRPRHSLLRTREFLMKDAYSFDADETGADVTYDKMREVYLKIFSEAGIKIVPISASTGEMGGRTSEELIAPSLNGEDRFFRRPDGSYTKVDDEKPSSDSLIETGIEVGHIFKLGKRYSEIMRVNFQDREGQLKPAIMGCYGIGISRLISAIIEQNHDANGIIWPETVSPFDFVVLSLGGSPQAYQSAETVSTFLESRGRTVLFDDRDKNPGVKLKDSDLLGIPRKVIIGQRSLEAGNVELEDRRTRDKRIIPLAQLELLL
jgi:prolyl-tRNA synthetase